MSESTERDELRKRILTIKTPVKWRDGKVIEYDSIGNDDIVDELIKLIDRFIQARETAARIDEMEIAHKAWLTSSLVDHMNNRLAQLKTAARGGW